ncbi:MAG: helix-turn-helix domain-containing protein [Deltaproteobacteria bacterium]|nr:helix-turn-helix domain-containing protein [Deltaproteobacteria bacterium]
MSIDEILTASEVANLLQVHPRTVYKLVKQGSLPGRKFGGGWRFSRRNITQMISSRESAARPQSEDLEGR